MTTIRVDVRSDRRIEDAIKQIQLDMQFKVLMRTVRKAALLFQHEAQTQARRLSAEGRDRWGKVTAVPLSRSIKRQGFTRGTRAVGRTRTVGVASAYAASVEFGHRAFIFGRYRGGRVRPHPFWRPAQDITKPKISQTMVTELKRQLSRLGEAR